MSMLGRTGTVVRKQRRRSSTASRGSSRRESAPTPSPTLCLSPSPSPSHVGLDGSTGLSTYTGGHRHSCYSFYSHLTPSPYPSHYGTNCGTTSPEVSPLSALPGADAAKHTTFTFDVTPTANGGFKVGQPDRVAL